MTHKWGYIGGGSALILAGLIAGHYGQQLQPRADGAPAAMDAPPPPPPPIATVVAEPAEDETAKLLEALADREAENKRLQTALTVSETVLNGLQATADQRQAALDKLTADLAASQDEVKSLREQLAALRAPSSFDAALLKLKSGAAPSAARIEATSADSTDIKAMFDAAEAPAPARAAVITPRRATQEATAPMVEVQFDFASARLTPGGEAYAAVAAETLSGMTLERIRVVGHTDRVGSPAANRRLAAERARAVAEFLVAAGLPADLIETAGMGEAGAPVATDDGIAEPLNRSVAIIAVPQSAG